MGVARRMPPSICGQAPCWPLVSMHGSDSARKWLRPPRGCAGGFRQDTVRIEAVRALGADETAKRSRKLCCGSKHILGGQEKARWVGPGVSTLCFSLSANGPVGISWGRFLADEKSGSAWTKQPLSAGRFHALPCPLFSGADREVENTSAEPRILVGAPSGSERLSGRGRAPPIFCWDLVRDGITRDFCPCNWKALALHRRPLRKIQARVEQGQKRGPLRCRKSLRGILGREDKGTGLLNYRNSAEFR